MLLSKPKKFVLTMLVVFICTTLVQTVSANDYRNEVDLNKMAMDRYNIEEVEEEKYKEIRIECTYYTSLASCNSNDLGITASGKKLNTMTIAVPRKVGSKKPMYPFGTKIYIEGIGDRLVEDTGNPKYLKVKEDGTVIIDVYVPRNKGETDSQYRRRVLNMGRFTTTAKVYEE